MISGKNDGIDKRVIDYLVDKEISIGDYILNCGEIPITILINSINRLIIHTLDIEKIMNNTFERNLFGFSNYIKMNNKSPIIYNKEMVKQAIKKTSIYRPDLFE